MKDHCTIWYAKRTSETNAEVKTYSEPKSITTRFNYFTIMPANSRGNSEVMQYGETINQTWIAIANANFFDGEFKNDDVFYIEGHKPNTALEEKYGFGASANAIVDNVSYVRNTIKITLIVNQAQVTQ